jgi:hypothetical protein
MRNLLSKSLVAVGGFIAAMSWLSGIALHLYTILFAYKASGFFSALLTLIFPIIAQVFWIFKTWHITGEFINGFSFYVMVYLGWLAAGIGFTILGAAIAKEE